MNLFKMAWRNIWRSRRRTVVTVAAMTLALWVMILYSGLLEGYMVGMERNILNLELGDVQVFALDFRDNPSLYTRIILLAAWRPRFFCCLAQYITWRSIAFLISPL